MKRAALAGLLVTVAACGGGGKETVVPLPTASALASSAPPPALGGDVCQIPKSDMCLQFDDHSTLVNQKVCEKFDTGAFQAAGACAKELRLGSCRVAADRYAGIFFAGKNNDILDSQEYCEQALHGVFTATSTRDVTATWVKTELTSKFAGFTLLAPAQALQETHGASVSIERYSGYYGIILSHGTVTADEVKSDAMEGSEYFKFDSFVTETSTKFVWKVRDAKTSAPGYKFTVLLTVGGAHVICESLTVFDNMPLTDANIESCNSISRLPPR